mmetsp:Transcript_18576/g.47032  ORF Transcript_18576/g.47032 Transcript_18576/m.47032 type:complete len:214 (+) Transcript_18576:448-1089(+)
MSACTLDCTHATACARVSAVYSRHSGKQALCPEPNATTLKRTRAPAGRSWMKNSAAWRACSMRAPLMEPEQSTTNTISGARLGVAPASPSPSPPPPAPAPGRRGTKVASATRFVRGAPTPPGAGRAHSCTLMWPLPVGPATLPGAVAWSLLSSTGVRSTRRVKSLEGSPTASSTTTRLPAHPPSCHSCTVTAWLASTPATPRRASTRTSYARV